jgi:hypothetical protein
MTNQERHQQRDGIERQARKYAYQTHRRDNDLPGSGTSVMSRAPGCSSMR